MDQGLLSLIGVIATVVGAFGTFYGIYVTSKKDDKNLFLFTGHTTFIKQDNSVSLKINNYYSKYKSKKTLAPRQVIQSELVEFIIESIKSISYLKKIALIVSILFTVLYFIITMLNVQFLGVYYMQYVLQLSNSLTAYAIVYSSFFCVIYFSIMMLVSSYYSNEFLYQYNLRGNVTTNGLSQIRRILYKEFKIRKTDEFPIRSIDRMMENLRICDHNNKAVAYNNRTKNTPRKRTTNYKNVLLDNIYFKLIIFIIVVNVTYVFILSKDVNNHDVHDLNAESTYNYEICEPSYNEVMPNTENWIDNWRVKYANIFCDFTTINSPSGFYILNSPELSDIYDYNYDTSSRVSGFIRTPDQILYFTKDSYDSANPQFILIP